MAHRVKVSFRSGSGSDDCVAWHYPGTNRACVVMSPGAGITKEPGTDRFAAHFHQAGYSVVAFDHRHFGDSGGTPRQLLKVRTQLEDWRAALTFAAHLDDVDPAKIAIWGFSLSAGHVITIAGEADQPIAAAIAQTPFIDGLAFLPNALRHETPTVIARFPFIAAADAISGALRRHPKLIPLTGPRGAVAMLTTPDAQDSTRALNPDNRYPAWEQTIAARSVLPLALYRPTRAAKSVTVPTQVIIADGDQTSLPQRIVGMADRLHRAEVVHVEGGHYAPFLDQHDTVVAAELAFLERHLVRSGRGAS